MKEFIKYREFINENKSYNKIFFETWPLNRTNYCYSKSKKDLWIEEL